MLNLGRYERQYWQGVTFGSKRDRQEMTIFEYVAFMLRLYGAEPLAGTQYLHGKRGSAFVHVGAVDAPVTIDEANACVEECLALKQKELHLLGWEWEMGFHPYVVQEARTRGVTLLPLTIPREVMEQQAVDKGDVRFFELAYLHVNIRADSVATLQNQAVAATDPVVVALDDFVISNTDLIPPEVREKVRKWSDYIDYWAVDWDFRNDTFMNGWVTYRTRKDRRLALQTDPHAYEAPGCYTIMVKVVDIFGNDTTQAYDLEVR